MSALNKGKSAAYLHQQELKNLGAEGPKAGAMPMKLALRLAHQRRVRATHEREMQRETGMLVDNRKEKLQQDLKRRFGKLDRDDYLRSLKGNRSGLTRGNRIDQDALIGSYKDGVLKISGKDIMEMRSKRR